MKLFSPGRLLPERVVHAGFWSMLLYVTARAFGLVRTVVIARLLAPDDIGLFALASLALMSVETFTMTGFNAALIHREGDIERDLSITFTVHVIRGIFRAGLVLLISPLVAGFFREPQVEQLVQVIAFSSLVHGFSNTGVTHFRKSLEFHKDSALLFSRLCADLLVSVSAAIYLRSAWALVYGFVAGHAAQVIMSYVLHPFRPRFILDFKAVKSLFRYGMWMNLTAVMIFFSANGATMVIGRILDTNRLGLYHLAYWISMAALVGVAQVSGDVAFAAFSKIQHDAVRMRSAFVRVSGFMLVIALPTTVALFISGDVLVRFLLGEKWSGMIQCLRLMALAGCLHSIALSGRPVFMGLGHPRSLFHMQLIRAATLMVFIYPLCVLDGISGAAMAAVLSSLTMMMFWFFRTRGLLGLNLRDFVQILGPPVIVAAAISPVLVAYNHVADVYLSSMPVVLRMASIGVLMLAAAVVFILVLRIIQKYFPANQPLSAFRVLFKGAE